MANEGYALVFVGFGEEIFSRGYHLRNISEGCRFAGPVVSVLVATLLSSLFFGALHAVNPNASLSSTLYVSIAGLMLAIGRITTGSLAAPVGLHISWNWVQGPILRFPVSGQRLDDNLIETVQRGPQLWTGGEFGPESGLIGVAAMTGVVLGFLLYASITKSRLRRSLAKLVIYRRVTGHL